MLLQRSSHEKTKNIHKSERKVHHMSPIFSRVQWTSKESNIEFSGEESNIEFSGVEFNIEFSGRRRSPISRGPRENINKDVQHSFK